MQSYSSFILSMRMKENGIEFLIVLSKIIHQYSVFENIIEG